MKAAAAVRYEQAEAHRLAIVAERTRRARIQAVRDRENAEHRERLATIVRAAGGTSPAFSRAVRAAEWRDSGANRRRLAHLQDLADRYAKQHGDTPAIQEERRKAIS